jgi:hypothetical protein
MTHVSHWSIPGMAEQTASHVVELLMVVLLGVTATILVLNIRDTLPPRAKMLWSVGDWTVVVMIALAVMRIAQGQMSQWLASRTQLSSTTPSAPPPMR